MSNRCPYCGAAGGKSHEPCPHAPGGKFYKAPAQKKPLPKTVEIVEAPIGTVIHETAPVPDEVFSKPRERQAKVAELQTKAEGVKARTPRPLSRAGKKAATIWLTPDEMKRLQRAALDHEVPQERILAEGLAVMLGGKYKI